MTGRSRATARRLLAGLGSLVITAGAGLVVAVGTAAATPGGLSGEALVLPITGRYDDCVSGASAYSFGVEGEVTGPRAGHYVGRVSSEVDDSNVVIVVEATIGTADGDLELTQTGVADVGPSGACVPLQPGQALTWTAEIAGERAGAGTALLTGEPSALVDLLTTTDVDDPVVTEDPLPTDDPVPPDDPVPTPPAPDTPGAPTADPTTVDTDIVFHYRVLARDGRLSGTCDVRGGTQADPVHVVCTDVHTYERHGHALSFSGTGTMNGRATTYRIWIVDGRGLASGRDSFLIHAGNDYVGGGELSSGDLRLR
jgi:hypothetical protein